MQALPRLPSTLQQLQNPPAQLYFLGDVGLLDSTPKVAIVGTRKPNTYAQVQTTLLARALSEIGATIISGGALGIDILAHQAALPRTICVLPSSLDRFYPKSNAAIIAQIATHGLLLSEHEQNHQPQAYHFLQRNRLIIALSDIVIIPQADRFSGSLSSANISKKLNKPLYTLSHRIGESLGTQDLLLSGTAKPIYDIGVFVREIAVRFGLASGAGEAESQDDEIICFARENPSFEEAFLRFGDRVLEYELLGKITRVNGRIMPN